MMQYKTWKIILISTSLFLPYVSFAEHFKSGTYYQTCFTPGENCTDLIVNNIESAKESIYMQAYSFTSAPIAKAILNAKRKGIQVFVLLDKSQVKNNKYSSSKFLINSDIPVFIDHKPAIAHNKVIIIDEILLITGSFNFTQAAQHKNAENIIIIKDKKLATKYLSYWKTRYSLSKDAKEYMDKNLTLTSLNL